MRALNYIRSLFELWVSLFIYWLFDRNALYAFLLSYIFLIYLIYIISYLILYILYISYYHIYMKESKDVAQSGVSSKWTWHTRYQFRFKVLVKPCFKIHLNFWNTTKLSSLIDYNTYNYVFLVWLFPTFFNVSVYSVSYFSFIYLCAVIFSVICWHASWMPNFYLVQEILVTLRVLSKGQGNKQALIWHLLIFPSCYQPDQLS